MLIYTIIFTLFLRESETQKNICTVTFKFRVFNPTQNIFNEGINVYCFN